MNFQTLLRRSSPRSVRAPPHDEPRLGKAAQTVDAQAVQLVVLRVAQVDAQAGRAPDDRVQAGRRFPDSAHRVGAGDDARYGAAGCHHPRFAVAQRIGLHQAGKVDRGVRRLRQAIQPCDGVTAPLPRVRGIDDQECPPHLTIPGGIGDHGLVHVLVRDAVHRAIRRNTQQVEEVGLLERIQARPRRRRAAADEAILGQLLVIVRKGSRLDAGGRLRKQPHDDCPAAAVVVEIAHRVAQRRAGPQAAEVALELGKAVELDRRFDRPAAGAADERRDRSRDARYRAPTVVGVDAGGRRGGWHGPIRGRESIGLLLQQWLLACFYRRKCAIPAAG
jgi:hypothetical protein